MADEHGRGAPLGNKNASHAKPFLNALERAIAQEDAKRLRAAAEKLLDMAAEGVPWALEFLVERLDGRVAQSVSISGEVAHTVRSVSETDSLLEGVLAGGSDRALQKPVSH
jgi:uncharacterized lipoprotein YmbA